MNRCQWAGPSEIYIQYHDREWGVPSFDDRHLFEKLVLEGAQAGLSWITILNKRENYRKAYAGFDPEKVAGFTRNKIATLLQNPGIVRNRLKIVSSVENARAFLKIQEKYGTFHEYIWQFVEGSPIINSFQSHEDIPAQTDISKTMSKALKANGFKFVGPTICYAYMQSVGMVNDHVVSCFRYRELLSSPQRDIAI